MPKPRPSTPRIRFYDSCEPTTWPEMYRIGEWFQAFPSIDCAVTQSVVAVLRAAEDGGITVSSLDIRVAVADWLLDRDRKRLSGMDEVLVVLVYRMEQDGHYMIASTHVMVHLEPRHLDNRLLMAL